jgi:hypothetical protein
MEVYCVIHACSYSNLTVTRHGVTLLRVDVPRLRTGPPEWLAPIVAVISGQAAALRMGELRGVDVDQPHGLSKMTVTR